MEKIGQPTSEKDFESGFNRTFGGAGIIVGRSKFPPLFGIVFEDLILGEH